MNQMLVYLAAAFLVLQAISLQADAKAISESVKNAAKDLALKAADKADEVTEVPKTGGIRQTILHGVTDLALNKGVALLETKYPAFKAVTPIATKLAKPVMNKVHESINTMMEKRAEQKAEEAQTAAPEAKEEADVADKKEKEGDDKKDEGKKEETQEKVDKKDEKVEEKEEVKENKADEKDKKEEKDEAATEAPKKDKSEKDGDKKDKKSE